MGIRCCGIVSGSTWEDMSYILNSEYPLSIGFDNLYNIGFRVRSLDFRSYYEDHGDNVN